VEVTVRIITLDPSVVTDLEDIVVRFSCGVAPSIDGLWSCHFFKKSLEVLRSIDHPNVLKVLHWFIDEASNTLWMVYEPNSWTSLFEVRFLICSLTYLSFRLLTMFCVRFSLAPSRAWKRL